MSVVILVAIAVVIASSLAAFASGFFNNYSQSPNVKILGLEVNEDGTGMINLVNSGGGSDSLQSLQVHPFDAVVLNAGDYQQHNTRNNNNGNNGNHGIGVGIGSLNDPTPQCTEHSENGNCLHDQDRGKSGDSHGLQNDNNNNNDNSNNSNEGGVDDALSDTDTVSPALIVDNVIPANSKKEISWEDSLGEFSHGQQITVSIVFASGNELTYYITIS